MSRQQWILYSLITVAVGLRLFFALTATLDLAELGGGDSRWYMAQGLVFYTSNPIGNAYGVAVDLTTLPTAPLYPLFVGFWLNLLPFEAALMTIRLLQVALNVLTCYVAYDIASRLGKDKRVGWIAAFALLYSPAMILEVQYIRTETLYIALLFVGIWASVRVLDDDTQHSLRCLIGAATAFGLATLTRAVGILFPVGIAGLLVVAGWSQWRRMLVLAVAFLALYAAIVSTWTVYNAIAYDRFVIASSELMPAIWRGAVVDRAGSPQENDALLGEQTVTEQTATIVTSDPLGYLQTRVRDLSRSVLQPHGTIPLGDESLRAMVAAWMDDGFSANGLWRLVNGDGFWAKSLIYLWHVGGMVFGMIGIVISRERWRISLTLLGLIVYTLLAHLVFLALPRYIFPTHPAFWILASVALWRLLQFIQQRRPSERA